MIVRTIIMPVTQKEIAKRLGVSPQAVGFGLRGDGTLSQEMRQRVLHMASEMGYDKFSNNEARILSSQRHGKKVLTGMIAVLRDRDYNGTPLREIPYFTPMLDGIEIEAMNLGLDVAMCSLHGDELPRIIRNEKVDGLIVMTWQEKILQACHGLNMPKVGLLMPGISDHAIEVDDEEGAYLVTKHLLELGHRCIALLGLSVGTPLGRTRSAGYRRAMLEASISKEEHIVEDTLPYITLEQAALATKNLLEKRPDITAIFGMGDWVAIGAMQQVQRDGIRVPEEMSIVGLDDFSGPYNLSPTLTSVSFDFLSMGHRAVQWLHERSTGQDKDFIRMPTEVFPPTLQVRNSSAPPRSK